MGVVRRRCLAGPIGMAAFAMLSLVLLRPGIAHAEEMSVGTTDAAVGICSPCEGEGEGAPAVLAGLGPVEAVGEPDACDEWQHDDVDVPQIPAEEADDAPVMTYDADAEDAQGGAVPGQDESLQVAAVSPPVVAGVAYNAHVQNRGWMDGVVDGATAGTTGQGLRVEAMEVSVIDADGNAVDDALSYRAHVQNLGWQEWRGGGEVAGTVGQSLRVEAMMARLSESLSASYDVYYRVHVKNLGWLAWASNGDAAGTVGQGLRVEAVQILLLGKGEVPLADGSQQAYAFLGNVGVVVSAHVQNVGWMEGVANGVSGTTGRGLRMEAIRASVANMPYEGSVTYAAHVQNVGWQNEVSDGALAGTTGRGLRVEALSLALAGELSEVFDLWYRVHVSSYGWLGWTTAGYAGTQGISHRVEAIETRLVRHGEPAPDATGSVMTGAFVLATDVAYEVVDEGGAITDAVSGGLAGTASGSAISSFAARALIREGSVTGGISYQVRLSDGTWVAAADGEAAGMEGAGADAIRVTLDGDLAVAFGAYYCVHVTDVGWLAWATNGALAGTTGMGEAIDGVRVMLVARGSNAPVPSDAERLTANYGQDWGDVRADIIERYLAWAVDVARDDAHGYSQVRRWGPDYDCSSLVIAALQAAGLPVGDAFYTGNMRASLMRHGWEAMPYTGSDKLMRGDILLHEVRHTELYLGGGVNVGAHIAETGGIDGAPGDQTGREISVLATDNDAKGWEYVLRLC